MEAQRRQSHSPNSEFGREDLLRELRKTRPLTVVRWILSCPLLAMMLAAMVPIILAAVAFTYSIDIDESIESFKIRDHPVAELEDALNGAISETDQFWSRYSGSQAGLQGRRLNSMEHSNFHSDALNVSSARSLLQSLGGNRRLTSTWRIHVVYSMQDGSSVWNEDAMYWIQEFEERVRAIPGYDRFCVHLWEQEGVRECRPPNSLINYVFPSFNDAGNAIYDGKGTKVSALFNLGRQLAVRGQFWYVDGDADLTDGRANSIRTDFLFGTPVDGYASPYDRSSQQEQEYQSFVKSFYDVLQDASDDVILVNFGGDMLTDYEIRQALLQDIKKIVWGLLAVLLFAWWHTQSLFIAVVGILEIGASFPVAYFFHRVVLGIETLNVIQFLGLFIILGIGVDDVFVFFDTYASTLPLYGDVHPVLRLSHAYRRAGAAMAVTSFTSAIAFAANIISAIPAVRVFGMFLAIMVTVNYLLVMTWFPACVAFWEAHILDRRMQNSNSRDVKGVGFWCAMLCGPTPLQNGLGLKIQRYADRFWKWHSKFIYKGRVILLLIFLGVSAAGVYGVTLLKGSNTVPAIFPEYHNVQRFLDLWESKFLSSNSCDRCWREFKTPIRGDVSPELLASFSTRPLGEVFSGDVSSASGINANFYTNITKPGIGGVATFNVPEPGSNSSPATESGDSTVLEPFVPGQNFSLPMSAVGSGMPPVEVFPSLNGSNVTVLPPGMVIPPMMPPKPPKPVSRTKPSGVEDSSLNSTSNLDPESGSGLNAPEGSDVSDQLPEMNEAPSKNTQPPAKSDRTVAEKPETRDKTNGNVSGSGGRNGAVETRVNAPVPKENAEDDSAQLPAPVPPPLAPPDPTVVLQTALDQRVKKTLKIEDVTDTSALLKWPSESTVGRNDVTFVIDGRADGSSNWEEFYSGDETEVRIKSLQPSTGYQFRLGASSGGQTALGKPVLFKTLRFNTPRSPINVYGFDSTANSVKITWEYPSDAPEPIDGFTVDLSPVADVDVSAVTYRFDSNMTSAVLGPLDSGTAYRVCVSAVNEMGSGEPYCTIVETLEADRAFPDDGIQGETVQSRFLKRSVRLTIMDPTTEAAAGRRLLATDTSVPIVYAILPYGEGDAFPEPDSISGQGRLAELVRRGAGKQSETVKLEESLLSIYSGFSSQAEVGLTKMLLVVVERLPGDDDHSFASWIEEELLIKVEGASDDRAKQRGARALLGMRHGAADTLKTGMKLRSLFRSVVLLHPEIDADVSIPVPRNASGVLGDRDDVFIYTTQSVGALDELENLGVCSELVDVSVPALLEARAQCNIFVDQESEEADFYGSGVRGFSFLSDLFSIRALESKFSSKPKRSNSARLSIVWGIKSVDRTKADVDPFSANKGTPVYDEHFDITSMETQTWLVSVCEELNNRTDLVEGKDRCFIQHFRDWVKDRRELSADMPSFPVPPERLLEELWKFVGFFRDRYDQDVGYVLDNRVATGRAAGGDAYPKPKWIRITVKSKLDNRVSSKDAYREWVKWTDAVNELNGKAPDTAGAMRHTNDLWVRIWTEREVVQSTKWAIIIAGICALLAIVVFTGDPWMAFLALCNLGGIISVMLGFFYLIGWELGAIEAISVTILVGLSVDFALHIAEAYSKSQLDSRGARAMESVQRMGSPIVAAALTTILACVPLLTATILILKFFGIVVASSIALSVVFGLYFFCPLLMVIGPKGTWFPKGKLPGWLEQIGGAIWGSGLRRGALLSALALGGLMSFESGRQLLMDQKWLLLFAGVLFVVTIVVEIVRFCEKCRDNCPGRRPGASNTGNLANRPLHHARNKFRGSRHRTASENGELQSSTTSVQIPEPLDASIFLPGGGIRGWQTDLEMSKTTNGERGSNGTSSGASMEPQVSQGPLLDSIQLTSSKNERTRG